MPRASSPSPARGAARAGLLAALAALAAGLALAGCGDTVQAKPIPHNELETMIVAPFPVYWAGGSFQQMQITEVAPDPSGAFTVQYGNCLQGGQGTCTPPLQIVTNPDNSFLAGGRAPSSDARLRGVPVKLAEAGRTVTIPTGGVVVSIFARDARLAASAAQAIVAINRPQSPGEALPAPLPDTGFGSTPLPSQRPATARPAS
ncbi:MAG TPA: hypothetical protein VNV44_12415 [Solirubrobacteraceae bacterium]|jgi:hypothetical protein|nr:hypothetical protein [Solirubrobacteraceae bacterium]